MEPMGIAVVSFFFWGGPRFQRCLGFIGFSDVFQEFEARGLGET